MLGLRNLCLFMFPPTCTSNGSEICLWHLPSQYLGLVERQGGNLLKDAARRAVAVGEALIPHLRRVSRVMTS